MNEIGYIKIGGDNGCEYGIVMAIQLSTMKIYQIEEDELKVLRFVNNNISNLVLCLFHWEQMIKKVKTTPISKALDELKRIYNEIDEEILMDESSYWSLLIEDIETNY